ncbi:MAG: monovalent cation/H(+) antiporter subunit G [Saprospirales bacterium]|nr:MAG: monovalent cation/H(+) antiporter subunit G [Saprospirales bacterium]
MSDFLMALIGTIGALFILLAAIGMLRMPDFYLRVSVATKGGSLGVGLILVAAAIHFSDFGITTRALAILFFILITAPVSAHLLGRVAYMSKVGLWKDTSRDDLAEEILEEEANELKIKDDRHNPEKADLM